MPRNMGKTDRIIRAAFAVLVAVLWLTGTIGGTLAIVLGVAAAILLATSLVGTCPLYMPFGISTSRARPGTTV